ncbi:hypothetical protein POPTR_001G320601v4 [Populus trichocarpa]|uniref:Uncharacterized protein n=1 Tax=Populus trichocarpa TaxID=3694 RepID=A0ACC0TMD6_POPTR|nr:hypothetical protein POPTR_001G320601v4 [Populus trichocarpa]
MENKREFILYNTRGDEMHMTLWGDNTRNFDEATLQTLQSPITLIAFAGFCVTEYQGRQNLNGSTASIWYFNPDTHEALAYYHYFGKLPVKVYQLPSSSNVVLSLVKHMNENKKTIKEILCMNPYEHKDMRSTCPTSIADYDIFNGWWYPSCPCCNKKLGGTKTNPVCMDHDAITSLPMPWF